MSVSVVLPVHCNKNFLFLIVSFRTTNTSTNFSSIVVRSDQHMTSRTEASSGADNLQIIRLRHPTPSRLLPCLGALDTLWLWMLRYGVECSEHVAVLHSVEP